MNTSSVSASDPWLTIFGDWFTHGWVKNLRIFGEPQVPDAIDLFADDRLLGWDAFFGTVEGNDADWEIVKTEGTEESSDVAPFVLQGKRRDMVNGCWCERLLRYHRPIFEDATFSYEFFYRNGSHAVHPTIGGRAFIFDAEARVIVHEVTNGVYERTIKRPQTQPAATTSAKKFPTNPLHSDQWNRMTIRIRDDQIEFVLNDHPIHEATLDRESDRCFGLFHYCDQSEALVRNLRWAGDWPKTLDAATSRSLQDTTLEETIAGLNLEQSYHHEFADGIPLESFAVLGGDWKGNITNTQRGVHMVRPGGNFVQYVIVPHLEMDGDFDVIAEFEDFQSTIASGGDANIQLMLGFPTQTADYRFYRKFSRFAEKELGRQIIQAAHFYSREGHRTYEFPKLTSEAATGGKLRFVRHGDRLLYLFAAGESANYRLLHSESVTPEPTRPGGISLVIETTKQGEARVVWKSLDVRAERLTGKALETSLSVEQLDASRDALSSRFELNFSDPVSSRRVQTWGTGANFEQLKEGLRVTAPGYKDWHGHGLSPRVSIHGDFDIQLELQVEHLERPQPGGECVVYLETEFQDRLKTALQSKFAMSSGGATNGEFTHRFLRETGELDYQELVNYPLESVHALRIARRAETGYVLIQETANSRPIVLGRVDFERVPVSVGNLRAVLHTAGIDRKTIALFKRLTIHAEIIQR
ncbi:MAG: DUF1583 domain-containing protein [Pirellulaceae bacterium]